MSDEKRARIATGETLLPPSINRAPAAGASEEEKQRSRRRGVPMSEIVEYARLWAKLHGTDLDRAMQAGPDQVARAMVDQDERQQELESIASALSGDTSLLTDRMSALIATTNELLLSADLMRGSIRKKRGRPPTEARRHLLISITIEAFRAAGLSSDRAIVLAKNEWNLSTTTVEKIHKKKGLRAESWNHIRNYFSDMTEQEIIEYIRHFRAIEQPTRRKSTGSRKK